MLLDRLFQRWQAIFVDRSGLQGALQGLGRYQGVDPLGQLGKQPNGVGPDGLSQTRVNTFECRQAAVLQ
jgi:hypothetical protein